MISLALKFEKIVYLDSNCNDILKKCPSKKQSEFVREAIVFYDKNKDKEINESSEVPEMTEVKVLL